MKLKKSAKKQPFPLQTGSYKLELSSLVVINEEDRVTIGFRIMDPIEHKGKTLMVEVEKLCVVEEQEKE